MSELADTEIRVLSFNCWGLKFVSKDRQLRFHAIAEELAESPYDVIALQEVWVRADYEIIRSKVARRLPHAKLFYAGALGAGVAILSRFPILETSSFPYTHNGSPINVADGDWIVGKGLFSVLLSHPILYEVEVFNTHMSAGGGDEGHNEVVRISRITAAWEFTKRIRHSAALGRHVIVAGDFNSIPTSLVMSIIREHGLLNDAWSASHGAADTFLDSETGEIDSPEEAIEVHGMTADSPLNSYSAAKNIKGIAARWKGKRLDYILYRGPTRSHRRWRRSGEQSSANGVLTNGSTNEDLLEDVPTLHCTSSKVVMTGTVPGYNISLSDHFGVEANFVVQYPSPRQVSPPPAAPTVWETAATPTSAPFTPPSLAQQQRPYMDAELPSDSHSPPTRFNALAGDIGGDSLDIEISQLTVQAMLQAIGGAYRQARLQSRKQLFVFGSCVVLVVVLTIGSAWQPIPALNPLFILVGAVFTWLGTTMLYAGFIWGNWELNWLMTVAEELELLKRGRIAVVGR